MHCTLHLQSRRIKVSRPTNTCSLSIALWSKNSKDGKIILSEVESNSVCAWQVKIKREEELQSAYP